MSEPENRIKEVRVLFEDGSCQVGAKFDISYEEKIKALQAEVDKWQGAEHAVSNKLEEICKETIRLQAENERLRKAGDAMAAMFRFAPNTPPRFISEWLAAKGLQSTPQGPG